MTVESMIAILGILGAAAWTPGPNNAMLAASAANYGFRRTLPHAQGVAWGFPLMIFCVALGLGQIFQAVPILHEVLRFGGAALLLWVAWRIATASGGLGSGRDGRPFTFFQAAAFQWVNPKAWVMCVSVVSQFVTGTAPLREAAILALIALSMSLTSAHGWAAFGAALQRVLNTPLRLRIFNIAMASFIALGVIYLFEDWFR
ncbi:LysE family translocator [Oceanomicrobium pacificus]|uniref:LysE family transporter n=1 Tax=Oceanomicrobium pacificus TaxID=2692916 RepID=A0A6B0U1F2_9RHOB|nr:LysE family translocator [Oceanomicrobium pacificus]MXU64931.1 LysE family transporter [Oceanomicrobium pacificus]